MTPELFARVTLAISDNCAGGLEGFAPLSDPLPAAAFEAATEDGETMGQTGDHYAVFIDLMDGEHTQIGEKCISISQAATLTGLAPELLVPLGRQRLAEINDEASAYIRRAKEQP